MHLMMTDLNGIKQPSGESPLTHLPLDILQFILSYTTLQDLLSLSLVSKSVKHLTSLTNTLQIVVLPNNSSSRLNRISNHKLLNLRKSLPNMMNLEPISSSVSFPTSIATTVSNNVNGNSSSQHSQTTATREHHPNPLLTESMLRHVLPRFLYLSTIKLYNLEHLDHRFLHIMESYLSLRNHINILHVEFHNVHMTHDIPIAPDSANTIQFMNHAQHIEVHGTIFSRGSSLKCFTSSPYLVHLKLNGCRSLYDEEMDHILPPDHSPLRILSLENTSQIIAPRIQYETLEKLDLRQCVTLSRLNGIRCKDLIEVNLSYCTKIGNGQVESLLLQSPQIERLFLNACAGISTLVIFSNHLQTLDLNLCTSLHDVSLDCAALEYCELGMCMKLNQLYLHSDVIRNLDLSMLLLSRITIDTPRLTTLNLSGCFKMMNEGVSLMNCHKLVDVDICETNLDGELFTTATTSLSQGEMYNVHKSKSVVHGNNSPSAANITKVKVKQGGTGMDWMKMAGVEY